MVVLTEGREETTMEHPISTTDKLWPSLTQEQVKGVDFGKTMTKIVSLFLCFVSRFWRFYFMKANENGNSRNFEGKESKKVEAWLESSKIKR